mgnify:CR=1 FL=1
MKKFIIITLAALLTASATSCKSSVYTAEGISYEDGRIVTADGNEWQVEHCINGDGTEVIVRFDNNGTPNKITDDIILSVNYKEYPAK